MIQTGAARSCTHVKQNAYIGVQQRSKGAEKPSVRVELLCVLFLETENDLDRNTALVGTKDFASFSIHHDLRGVLIDMCCYSTSSNFSLCYSFLSFVSMR
jgi:hypothetical protein